MWPHRYASLGHSWRRAVLEVTHCCFSQSSRRPSPGLEQGQTRAATSFQQVKALCLISDGSAMLSQRGYSSKG